MAKTNDPTGYGIRHQAPDLGPLFAPPAPVAHSPSSEAHPLPRSVEVSAKVAESRSQRILQFITNNGPTTIFEFCQACTSGSVIVHAHQVSGRFTDLAGKRLPHHDR